MGTARLNLPFLVPGQSQKELFLNEALQLVDMLVQPIVEALGASTPPASPTIGQMFIVGDSAAGEWAGHSHDLAALTQGGWRFTRAFEGLTVLLRISGMPVRFAGGQWREGQLEARSLHVDGRRVVGPQSSAIADATGGSVIDVEARKTVANILVVLRHHGLIAG